MSSIRLGLRIELWNCMLAAIWFSLPVSAQDFPNRGPTAETLRGMVVTVSQPASEVGLRILDSGGNAVDAAVAIGFALAVTWPEAGNIGGGGFMLVHPSNDGAPTMFDYRECAPAAATVNMFASGTPSEYRLVGVPGTVRGLQLAHKRFGRLSWDAVVMPSVELARDGFLVSKELAKSLNGAIESNRDNREFQRVYARDQGRRPWQAGDRLVQPDLAATLLAIANDGPDAFYTGTIASAIQAEMQRGGGLITTDDLAAYRAVERVPVHGTYRNQDVYASCPPSSGGTVLIEMLNIAEDYNLGHDGRWSLRTLHVMTECMRRAYCDRARFLGDPDYNRIPSQLISKDYAGKLRETISDAEASSSAVIGTDILSQAESPNTTHFSVIDRDGMAVSNTYTLEDDFGSKIVVQGAGFLLNNEMGDFNPKPGVTDDAGLIGTKPNLVAPKKRMLSSMCPTIVSQNGRVVLVTGSPGGRTIINTLFCVLMNVLEFEMPLRDAIDAPRMHHQWMPDKLTVEPELAERIELIESMKRIGHKIDPKPAPQGDAHSIYVFPNGKRLGAADHRRGGWAVGQ